MNAIKRRIHLLLAALVAMACNPLGGGSSIQSQFQPGFLDAGATRLKFTRQPSLTGDVGQDLASAPEITAQDSSGKAVSMSGFTIHLELYSDPDCLVSVLKTPSGASAIIGNVSLTSTSTGVSPSQIRIQSAGTVYLGVSAIGLTSDCSEAIQIAPGTFSTTQSTLSVSHNTVLMADTTVATMTLKDAFGNSNATGAVSPSFTSTSTSGTGSWGATTGSNGVYQATFTPQTLGTVTIGAKPTASLALTATQVISIVLEIPSATYSTLSATSPVLANDVSTSTIGVTFKDSSNAAIAGIAPSLTVSGTGNTVDCPSVSDASGNATCTLKSSVAETKTVTLTNGSINLTSSVVFSTPTADNTQSSITSTSPIVANGSSPSTVTITLEDSSGTPLVGTTPVIAVTGTGNTVGTCSATDTSGVSTCSVVSTVAESKTVSITSPSTISKTATIVFQVGAADNAQSSISATSPVTADGSTTSTVTITLKDASGNAISGTTPTISVTGTGNTVSSCSSTDGSGVSTCTIASTVAASKTISVTSPNTISKTATAVFVPGAASASNSTIVVSVGSLTANNSSAIPVAITLKDANNNAISGTTPTFEILNGTGTYTITTACPATDSSGVSNCAFKTFRGGQQIARITSPSSVNTVMHAPTITCASAATYFNTSTEGTGTSGSPFLVSSPAQLDQIRCNRGHYYKLTANIDMASVDWLTPQGNSLQVDIDGQNHTIANFHADINLTHYSAMGVSVGGAALIAATINTSGGVREIKNITFTDPNIVASGVSGTNGGDAAVVSTSTGNRIKNITVTGGTVVGTSAVGGIASRIGSLSGTSASASTQSVLQNCSFSGTVKYAATTATTNIYRGLGGILGMLQNAGADVSGNTFSGTVSDDGTARNQLGGIVGTINLNVSNTGEPFNISQNQVLNSTIITGGNYAGGIVGHQTIRPKGTSDNAEQLTIANNYVYNTNVTAATYVAGIIARNTVTNAGDITNKGTIIEKNAVIGGTFEYTTTAGLLGGIVGMMGPGIVRNNYVRGTHFVNTLGTQKYVGGIIGDGDRSSYASSTGVSASIEKCYASFTVATTSGSNQNGIIGRANPGSNGVAVNVTSDDSYFDTAPGLSENSPLNDNGRTTAVLQGGQTGTTFTSWSTSIWEFPASNYPRLASPNPNP